MNLLYFIISLFLYISAPAQYSFMFCAVIAFLFFLQSIPFVVRVSNGNYMNFHTLFLLSYFLTNYFYPLIIFPIDPYFINIFKLGFNELYINTGTALAQLSISSFILGASIVKNIGTDYKLSNIYRHRPVVILTWLFFILFVITVGKQFLEGNFDGHSTVSLYILLLITSSMPLATILFFKNKCNSGVILYYSLVVIYCGLFLAIGDRNPALSLIILIGGLYSFYIKKLKIKLILPLAIGGIFLMTIIGLGRTTHIENLQGNVISRGYNNLNNLNNTDNGNVFLEMSNDFVVNTRNLYVGLEYVNKHGYNYGSTLISSLIGIVPFAQTLWQGVFDVELETSATFFTKLYLGDKPEFGLGTNVVGDIYISFGAIGCIILFFILGRVIEYYRRSSIKNNDMLSLIAYFTFVSYSIYYPRSSLLFIVKLIIWTDLIFYILRKINILKISKNG